MKTNNRIKAAVITAVIAFMMIFMYSCQTNDVYSLVQKFISGAPTAFDIEGDLLIDAGYLIENGIIKEDEKDNIPSQIHINLKGTIEKEKTFYAYLTIDGKFSAYICCDKDKLYFEISDCAYIAVEFLKVLKIADGDAIRFFEKEIAADENADVSRYLSFDVSKFTLSKLESYFDYCDKFITFTPSKATFDNKAYKINFPSYSNKLEIKYENASANVKKQLSFLPKNRNDTVTVVFSGDENGSYLDMAGEKNKKSTVYPTKKLDCDINGFKAEQSIVMGEPIIPLRYFLETIGYKVGYNEKIKKAYFINDNGSEIYVDGVNINGNTYVSVLELIKRDFKLNIKSVGEYVEIEIYLN